MSEQADGGGADGGGVGRKTRDDPWMGTVTTVSGFLAGFSLASVVVISDAPEHFRWPGVAELALTVASALLIGAVVWSRNGTYNYVRYAKRWRRRVYAAYNGGLIALLVGLGAALAPLGGTAGTAGVAGQQGLRWAALSVAFAAALVVVGYVFWTLFTRKQVRDDLYKELDKDLRDRTGGHLEKRGCTRFWWSGEDDTTRLVIVPVWDGFVVYRVRDGEYCLIPRTGSVKKWLDDNNNKKWLDAAEPVKCPKAFQAARKRWRKAPEGEADT